MIDPTGLGIRRNVLRPLERELRELRIPSHPPRFLYDHREDQMTRAVTILTAAVVGIPLGSVIGLLMRAETTMAKVTRRQPLPEARENEQGNEHQKQV